jgi:predicted alpha/beta-hydrolase family hydrolase
MPEPFADDAVHPAVKGFIHRPQSPSGAGLVITHGAGGNAQSPLLIALADVFVRSGFAVLRCDLAFRQRKPYGPPSPSDAEHDRQGLKNAAAALRKIASGKIYLGGQSYGGRQASMLCAAEPGVADGLLLLSYPLHPPGKPEQLRTQHLSSLNTPVLFIQGTRDPFGSILEITQAMKLIPAKNALLPVDGAGHDLGFKGKAKNLELPATVLAEFQTFFV